MVRLPGETGYHTCIGRYHVNDCLVFGINRGLARDARHRRGLGLLTVLGERVNKAEPRLACTGRVGRRLTQLMGLSWDSYLRVCDRGNVLLPDESWDLPREDCVRRSSTIIEQVHSHYVLVLGRRPWNLLFVETAHVSLPWFSVALVENSSQHKKLFVNVPHPSGLNRWWNDPDNVAEAELQARFYLACAIRRASMETAS